jgi:hypothetical protein
MRSQSAFVGKQVELLCTSDPPVALGTVSSSLSCPMGDAPQKQNCCCSVALYAVCFIFCLVYLTATPLPAFVCVLGLSGEQTCRQSLEYLGSCVRV